MKIHMVEHASDSIAAEEYRGRDIKEVIIEMAVIQKIMLGDITVIKNDMSRKADKTEFTSWETRLSNDESAIETNKEKHHNETDQLRKDHDERLSSLDRFRWVLVGVATGSGFFSGVISALAIYSITKT